MSIALKELPTSPQHQIIQFRIAATNRTVTVKPVIPREQREVGYTRRELIVLNRQVGSRRLARTLLNMGVTNRGEAFQPHILAQLPPTYLRMLFERQLKVCLGNDSFKL